MEVVECVREKGDLRHQQSVGEMTIAVRCIDKEVHVVDGVVEYWGDG